MKIANKWVALGAMAALTSITSVRADNTAQVQVDTDHPKIETKVHTDRDGTVVRSDADLRADREMRAKLHNKASEFLGMEVKNNNNEKLGEVKDLVLDPQNGRVQYVVVAVGGFLGIGEKLLAVPYGSLRRSSTEDHKLIMNVSRERIVQAPGFAATNWPDVRDPSWDGATFWNELNQSNRGSGAINESGYDHSDKVKRDHKARIDTDDKKVEVETHVDTK